MLIMLGLAVYIDKVLSYLLCSTMSRSLVRTLVVSGYLHPQTKSSILLVCPSKSARTLVRRSYLRPKIILTTIELIGPYFVLMISTQSTYCFMASGMGP
jgi:hypothetical protein